MNIQAFRLVFALLALVVMSGCLAKREREEKAADPTPTWFCQHRSPGQH